MDETQNQSQPQSNTPTEGVGQTPSPQPEMSTPQSPEPKKKNSFALVLVGGAVVLGIAAFVMVFMGDTAENETPTGIDPDQVVAVVNGTDIVGAELATSINQITTTAQLQGVDTTDPAVLLEIEGQAVDMLVNTELLEQEAEARGITVTDAEVQNRIETLIQEVGSEEVLNERMASLGIDEETLERDVRSELVIQELLEEVFAEENIEVTEEEIIAFYEANTTGDEAAPTLEEVRVQVETQIRSAKEQAVVDEFISSLRNDADIVVVE